MEKNKNRTIIVINDVCDENGKAKQQARCHSLLGVVPIFVGVKDDLEAAGEVVDQYTNLLGAPGLIIAQSAPRTTETNKTNGTGFCYFWVEDTLFITSVKGHLLSLVKKFGITKEVKIINSDLALPLVGIEEERGSQFRSLEWLHAFAKYLLENADLPHEVVSINNFPDAPRAIWHVDRWKDHDSWGNCKTTITEDEVEGQESAEIAGKNIRIYEHLKDIPEGELGLIKKGSSGPKNRRFVEISVGNGNAAKFLGLYTGSII